LTEADITFEGAEGPDDILFIVADCLGLEALSEFVGYLVERVPCE